MASLVMVMRDDLYVFKWSNGNGGPHSPGTFHIPQDCWIWETLSKSKEMDMEQQQAKVTCRNQQWPHLPVDGSSSDLKQAFKAHPMTKITARGLSCVKSQNPYKKDVYINQPIC